MPEPDHPEQLPSVDALQFRRAQPINTGESAEHRSCVACKQLIAGEYYQVNNHVICPGCSAKIEAGKQASKPVPLFRPAIYGLGAALAGCILYAIPLALGFQIGIVALAVGWMVGKAIRHGSYGVGGRPQQILAVALTYFAISTSLIPVLLFMGVKQGIASRKQSVPKPTAAQPKITAAQLVTSVLIVGTISPFLQLRSSPVGGLISLFILFIGLQRAWAMTARHEILVTGPYT